jgi:hypothetical protein
MRRLIVVVLFVLLLPAVMSFETPRGVSDGVASAGRTVAGTYCVPCGCPGCQCEDGEVPGMCFTDGSPEPVDTVTSPVDDAMPAGMLLVFVFAVLAVRLR